MGDSLQMPHWWKGKPPLQLYRGVLCIGRHPAPKEARPPAIVLPRQYRDGLIARAHCTPPSGHVGVSNLLKKLRKQVYWPGQLRDVEEYVRRCGCRELKIVSGGRPRTYRTVPRGLISRVRPASVQEIETGLRPATVTV